jgi:hypothetical protein
MRTAVLSVALLAAAALPARAEPFRVASLAGTWSVVSTSQTVGSTCPNSMKEGETTAYTWLVSTTPDGKLQITVQGQTSFPKLTGFAADGKVMITGLGEPDLDRRLVPISWFFLTEASGGELVGTRQYLGFTAAPNMELKLPAVSAANGLPGYMIGSALIQQMSKQAEQAEAVRNLKTACIGMSNVRAKLL